MAQPAPPPLPVARTLTALAAVFVLLHLAGANDLLSDATRPVVVGTLRALGVAAVDGGSELVLGRLRVPWTRDCAGVNILTMLWAVTLWANRAEPLSARYWLRLAVAAPAAVLANIARIFTLLAYRWAFFPAVESPQLHYFIGFLWIVPCLPACVPRAGRDASRYLLETLFVVAALSLLSPFVPAPGGTWVTIATLLLLVRSRFTPLSRRGRVWAAGWVFAAAFIALASMESLWLPWLILCPWFRTIGGRHAPLRLVLVLGTIPLVAMQPVARWLIIGAAGFEVWTQFKGDAGPREAGANSDSGRDAIQALTQVGLAFLLVLPFVASAAAGLLRPSVRPPAGVMSRQIAANTFEVRLVGQPRDLTLTWYGPSGEGRHHTLPVCMRYRGIHLQPVPGVPSVMTDGAVWMKELFLQGDRLVSDYRGYLLRTFWPWTSAGVHVISSGPTNRLSAAAFAAQTDQLAAALVALDRHSPLER